MNKTIKIYQVIDRDDLFKEPDGGSVAVSENWTGNIEELAGVENDEEEGND